jgi:hypothetical protein
MKSRILQCGLSVILAVIFALPGYGQSVPQVVGVEEDWEAVLGEPDPEKSSPQILTWMSPTQSLDGQHFGVDLNLVQRPDFSSGGFQVRAFEDEVVVDNTFSENGDKLSYPGEIIRWTQKMFLFNNQIYCEVTNGSSQSWGAFGGPATRVSFLNAEVSNLNTYSPNRSLEWSGVGYGANRVEHLRLKTVRLFTSDGNVQSVPINAEIQ